MIPLRHIFSLRGCLLVLVFLLAIPAVLFGQQSAGPLPSGSVAGGSVRVDNYYAFWDERSIIVHQLPNYATVVRVWDPPVGEEIAHVTIKTGTTSYLVLLTDGEVFTISPVNQADDRRLGTLSTFVFSSVEGDALYAYSTAGVYVSRDTAKTWQIDSAGLGSFNYLQDIALDSSQYVYGGASKGLYEQHPDSSVWRRVDSLYVKNFNGTTSYPTVNKVFVDRHNRIWLNVLGGYGPFVSTDNGATWRHDTTGIGSGTILSFGDDGLGNVYAIVLSSGFTSFFGIYKTTDVGHSWTRIDQPLTAIIGSQSSNPFNSIAGDSAIFVATPFGFFQSTNQGTTWSEANQGIPAENIYSMLKLPSGRFLTSTDLGIFRREANDTVWAKTFPVNGYFGGRPLYQDGVGNVYTLGNFILPSYQYFVYKSTDEGTTWNPDTAGVKQSTSDGAFYVDETGTQHSVTADGSPYVANIAAKPLNGSWQADTNGFSAFTTAQYGYAFVSDGQGFLYLAGRFNGGNVWRRPIAGGTWMPDTAGLNGKTVHSFTRGRNGDVFAIAYGLTGSAQSPLLHRTGGVWSQINPPLAGASPLAISVDSTNAIFCAFGSGTFTFVSNGVYFSTDTGKTWTYAGLSGMTINNLVSYGDTTYALTQGNGAYLLRHQRAAAVAQKELRPGMYSLLQNYPNPFNPTTTISFSTPQRARLSLKVFDILGREVATLANGQMEAGMHQVSFDASKLSSGVYFYRLQAGSFVSVKKLVLLK